ncbi:AfsR/SARP family transcriptional regulator [Streptomyces sp. NPDC088732]|uniref:AfsR/SARP family transcriptional regulator n=1 Tax=Streptomyces sp. NPDC088732 TaxID=3365879 RepID=UPI0038269B72
MVVRFQILGPVRSWRDGAEVKLGPPKQRALFALLLAQSGQPVPLHAILDALWGQEPPETAVNVVHRHIGGLRRLLEPGLPTGSASRRLVRDAGGYRLEVEPAELDLLQFRALRVQARNLAQRGDRVRATGLLVDALGLWRGPTASGIAPEVRAHPVFAAVDNEHLVAVKEAAGYAPAAGDALTERVLITLRQAAAHHPLDEVLQARLIDLLAATGHQAEALEVYQGVRLRIADELGLDPGPELREAQYRVLDGTAVDRAAPAEAVPAPARPVVNPANPANPADTADAGDAAPPAGDAADDVPGGAAQLRPAQLPRDLAAFSGRRSELELSGTLLPVPAEPAQAVVISGMAGVGKTTLAVHWAHQVADRFPDGQLYLDLRGFHLTGAAMGTAEALRALLDAFGIPVGRIPAGLEAQAALYRSLLAGRRVLVVLDNARDSEQVRPLLPSAPGCLAVVTSRHQLQGLVTAEGARSLTLDLLGEDDAEELLALRLGAERVAREPLATAEIVALCGRLPLALAIVSARAALNPGFPLSAIADELRESHGSLDAFTGEPPLGDARSVFSWSYQALSPEAARLFRLLAVHPGPDCSVAAAASLAARRTGQTRALLAELVRAQLLFENAPGRFSSHGLLRAYATELTGEHDDPGEAAAAGVRLLDHYLHSAHTAVAALAPHRERLALRRPAAHTVPERFTDQRAAADWLDAERSVLLAAIEQDGRHGDGSHSWRLAVVLELYLDRNGRWQEQRTAQTTATTAAQRQGDVLGQAHAHRALGFALGRLDRWEGAREHLLRALQLFGEVGEPCGQARVHRYWAFLSNRHGRHDDALRHYGLAGDLYRAAGQLNGEASVHNEVGWTHMLLGEYDKAVEECRRSLAIHQETGDLNGEAAAWDSLGCAYHQLRGYEQALDCFRRALRMYREIRDGYLEADTLVHIADTHIAAGAVNGAAGALRQALAILEGIGHPDARGVREKLHGTGLNPVVPRVRV